MITAEVTRELEIEGQKFTLTKDSDYPFWNVRSGAYRWADKFTTYLKAKQFAENVVAKKKQKKNKEV